MFLFFCGRLSPEEACEEVDDPSLPLLGILGIRFDDAPTCAAICSCVNLAPADGLRQWKMGPLGPNSSFGITNGGTGGIDSL